MLSDVLEAKLRGVELQSRAIIYFGDAVRKSGKNEQAAAVSANITSDDHCVELQTRRMS